MIVLTNPKNSIKKSNSSIKNSIGNNMLMSYPILTFVLLIRVRSKACLYRICHESKDSNLVRFVELDSCAALLTNQLNTCKRLTINITQSTVNTQIIDDKKSPPHLSTPPLFKIMGTVNKASK